MPRTSMAQIRKCVYPFPVYEARFSDGSQTRMSFWTPLKEGINSERGRRLVLGTNFARDKTLADGFIDQGYSCLRKVRFQHAAALANRDFSAAREARLEFPAAKRDAIEHGRRFRDPHFTGEVIAMPKRRAGYKKALAELVAWADGDRSDDAALATARELVAA